ncbi:hypothetical protein ACHHYP_04801 [Achlya hypogyna]|uniref:Glutathione S-transferase n=1 Tax=Achlya hypogyna TaxID=1202772 RepID=A0A1V9Z013_ACHHY|nr:hypothetical protein ACHHYP_04801 [Achlya hypogyna]
MTCTNSIVVHYWAGRGMAEPLRVAIAAADADFTNHFLVTKADLTALREANKLDYGQVPMVEIDGKCLVQTQATLLYLARKYNLYPTTPDEQYVCDETMASCTDARRPLTRYPFTLDKVAVKASFNRDRYVAKWNTVLAPREHDYVLGATVCIADVMIFEVLDFYEAVFGAADLAADFEAFPHVLAHYARMATFGGIPKWKAARATAFVDWATYAAHVEQTLSE